MIVRVITMRITMSDYFIVKLVVWKREAGKVFGVWGKHMFPHP